jgi:MFS family permease
MRLWRNRAFVVLLSARTISFTGTGITTVVLPVLVYGMTHSPAWVASLGLIDFLPYLGFGLLAGAVADRVNRKKIMVGCDVTAALLLAGVPVAAGRVVMPGFPPARRGLGGGSRSGSGSRSWRVVR